MTMSDDEDVGITDEEESHPDDDAVLVMRVATEQGALKLGAALSQLHIGLDPCHFAVQNEGQETHRVEFPSPFAPGRYDAVFPFAYGGTAYYASNDHFIPAIRESLVHRASGTLFLKLPSGCNVRVRRMTNAEVEQQLQHFVVPLHHDDVVAAGIINCSLPIRYESNTTFFQVGAALQLCLMTNELRACHYCDEDHAQSAGVEIVVPPHVSIVCVSSIPSQRAVVHWHCDWHWNTFRLPKPPRYWVKLDVSNDYPIAVGGLPTERRCIDVAPECQFPAWKCYPHSGYASGKQREEWERPIAEREPTATERAVIDANPSGAAFANDGTEGHTMLFFLEGPNGFMWTQNR